LIALNEVQSMLSLGLESKEGALRTLGEEFPAMKLAEIRQELQDDAVADGALKLIQTQIEQDIMTLTGQMPAPVGPGGASTGSSASAATPMAPMAAPGNPAIMDDVLIADQIGDQAIRTKLVTQAYGTKLPQRRVPEEYEK
jgi:hypothetical protein